jgi:hypothetical protein
VTPLAALRDELLAEAEAIEMFPRPHGTRRHAYRSIERFVLDLGVAFEPAPLTQAEEAILDAAFRDFRVIVGPFAYKQCYRNAQQLLACDASGRLAYVEGYVWTLKKPVLHGWLSIGAKVVDVTGTPRGLPVPPEPPQIRGVFDASERAYLGVPFLRSYVRKRGRIGRGWGALLDDEDRGHELLRDGGAGAVRTRALCSAESATKTRSASAVA